MKNFLRKPRIQNIISYIFIQTYASLSCKGMNFKNDYKVCTFQIKIESESQLLFYKRLSYYSQRFGFKNPISIILCKQSHLAQLTFFIKNLVLFLKTYSYWFRT
jgi:hypothetical protein